MTRLHQATAVAIGGRALLIEGEPGSGKTSLALALIDRGAQLIGDDGVSLALDGETLLAAPAPATAGLIEVRNVGILRQPHTGPTPVALVVLLDREAPRHVESAGTCERGGACLPLIRLFPDSPVLAIRAELALATHGLPLAPPAQ